MGDTTDTDDDIDIMNDRVVYLSYMVLFDNRRIRIDAASPEEAMRTFVDRSWSKFKDDDTYIIRVHYRREKYWDFRFTKHIELFLDYERCTLVSGLMSLSLYSHREMNKRILVLGENHSVTDVCARSRGTSASDFFFKYLLDQTHQLTDVFGEWYFDIDNSDRFFRHRDQHDRSYTTQSFMVQVKNQLLDSNCLSAIKSNDHSICPYKEYVRIHLTDIRMSDTDIMKYFHYLQRFVNHIKTRRGIDDGKEFIEHVATFVRASGFDNKAVISRHLSEMFTSLKIRKQIDAIENESVKEYFVQTIFSLIYYVDYRPVTKDKFLGLLEHTLTTTKDDTAIATYLCVWSQTSQCDANGAKRLIYTAAQIMDIYLLSRVFRMFSHHESRSLNGSINNVIIYVGDAHADEYRRILLSLGFSMDYRAQKAEGGTSSCLDVSDFWPIYDH